MNWKLNFLSLTLYSHNMPQTKIKLTDRQKEVIRYMRESGKAIQYYAYYNNVPPHVGFSNDYSTRLTMPTFNKLKELGIIEQANVRSALLRDKTYILTPLGKSITI